MINYDATRNCHPFKFGRHMFVHNGSIGDFDDIRQEVEQLIKPQYFKSRFGSTDSEALFFISFIKWIRK